MVIGKISGIGIGPLDFFWDGLASKLMGSALNLQPYVALWFSL